MRNDGGEGSSDRVADRNVEVAKSRRPMRNKNMNQTLTKRQREGHYGKIYCYGKGIWCPFESPSVSVALTNSWAPLKRAIAAEEVRYKCVVRHTRRLGLNGQPVYDREVLKPEQEPAS